MTILPVQGTRTMDAAQTAKLKDGAKQFEAMMLEEMLKPLQFGGGVEDGDEAAGGASDTVRGFATEAVGKALAAGGGFGLARQIVRQVTAEHDARGREEAVLKSRGARRCKGGRRILTMAHTNGISGLQAVLSAANLHGVKVSGKVNGGTVAGDVDQARVSSAGGAVAQALTGSDVRTEKVAALQAAIAAGTYKVSAGDVAAMLIEGLLGK